MLTISELYSYPIKSLAGIKLSSAIVTDRGLEYDRRWMLIDQNNRFLSQREVAKMALLHVAIGDDVLTVNNTQDGTSIKIPKDPGNEHVIKVTIWDDACDAIPVSDEADRWFSQALGIACRLVFMPDESQRHTDPRYANEDSITSLSDAYPFLLIGQASLDDLNNRLDEKLLINRFRPNIVFAGGAPYQEDLMNSISINGVNFNGVKLCARCNVTTIDQSNAMIGKEPLKTLAKYRVKNKKIMFGQNLVHSDTGMISVGDELIINSIHSDDRFIIPIK